MSVILNKFTQSYWLSENQFRNKKKTYNYLEFSGKSLEKNTLYGIIHRLIVQYPVVAIYTPICYLF